MKAPDKIYLGIQDLGSGYVYDISLDNNGEQEYIRKDVLMEWANSWLAFKRRGIALDDGFSYAMEECNMTLTDLIQKAMAIQSQFNSSQIPIYHGDQECWFDLDVVSPRKLTDPWKINIINYREGKE